MSLRKKETLPPPLPEQGKRPPTHRELERFVYSQGSHAVVQVLSDRIFEPPAPYWINTEPFTAGGYAQIYWALPVAPENPNLCIAKSLLPSRATDPLAQQALREEYLFHSRLVHPNIATAYDWVEMPDGRPGFIEEFVGEVSAQGTSVRVRRTSAQDLLNTTPQGLTAHDLNTIFGQTLEAAKAIRDAGFFHLDLTPTNLLLTLENGSVQSVKVAGGGIHSGIQEHIFFPGRPDQTVGSPRYLSPERVANLPLSTPGMFPWELSEVFSLGLLYFSLRYGVSYLEDLSKSNVPGTLMQFLVNYFLGFSRDHLPQRERSNAALVAFFSRTLTMELRKRFQSLEELEAAWLATVRPSGSGGSR